MKKFLRSMHRGEKGFTLIELLVVVGILGTLAAVVALNVGSFIGTGQQQAACTDRKIVQTAVIAAMAADPSITAPTEAQYSVYLVGTSKGTYTVAAGGLVTQTAYPGGVCAP